MHPKISAADELPLVAEMSALGKSAFNPNLKIDLTIATALQTSSNANISSSPTEIATAIFSKLWDANDIVSSLCLALTCKSLHAVHKLRKGKRAVESDERSVRALTFEEQHANPYGVMMIFATLSTLLGDPQGQPLEADELFLWGQNIILQRKGTTDMFCLFRDINSAGKPKINVIMKDNLINLIASTRTNLFKKEIAWNHFQRMNNLVIKAQLPGSTEAGGVWSLSRILTTWYEYADGKGGTVTEEPAEPCMGQKEIVKKWLMRSKSPGWTNM